jgi:hypothetical protein
MISFISNIFFPRSMMGTKYPTLRFDLMDNDQTIDACKWQKGNTYPTNKDICTFKHLKKRKGDMQQHIAWKRCLAKFKTDLQQHTARKRPWANGGHLQHSILSKAKWKEKKFKTLQIPKNNKMYPLRINGLNIHKLVDIYSIDLYVCRLNETRPETPFQATRECGYAEGLQIEEVEYMPEVNDYSLMNWRQRKRKWEQPIE